MSLEKRKSRLSSTDRDLAEKRIRIMEEKYMSNSEEVKNISENNTPEEEQTVTSPFLPYNIKSFSETHMESTIIDHTWKINQFLRFREIKNAITFSSFPKLGKCEILMNVSRQPDRRYVIKFYILTSNSFDGSCTTSIMLEPETVTSLNYISGHISNMTLLSEISTDKFASFSHRVFRTDTLTIRCEFEIFHKLINKTVRIRLFQSSTEVSKVNSKKDSTFDESKNEELIKFIIGDKQYVISRKSLCATNSSYFKNICLTHEGKEKNMTNELVTDNEVEAFRQILLYISTGSIDQSDYDMLKELLTAADKYNVSALKLTCENYLLRYITIENAVELIQLALSLNAKFLETFSIRFIKFHIKEIMYTKEFQNLPQEDLSKIMVLIEKSKPLEIDIHQFFSSPPTADKTFSFENI